jgi:outer membrane protein, multidrug efflux system
MPMFRSITTLSVAAALATAAGCALKPPPPREDITTQSLQIFRVQEGWAATPGPSAPVADRWLASFNDPQLDTLVQEALAFNPDLLVAAARVEQAAGYVKLSGATLYPQINLIGSGSLGQDSSGLQGVGVFLNWELDLWGRIRSGREASQFQYVSAGLDAEYARQSITALVAKGWFLSTEARLQKAIAEDMVAASERQLGFAQDRLRVGVGDEYDVTASAASTLPTSRHCARSSCSWGGIRLRRSAFRRNWRRCLPRCLWACPRYCSNADPMWWRRSVVSPLRSTGLKRPRPHGCRAFR